MISVVMPKLFTEDFYHFVTITSFSNINLIKGHLKFVEIVKNSLKNYLNSQWADNDKICIFRFLMTQYFQKGINVPGWNIGEIHYHIENKTNGG